MPRQAGSRKPPITAQRIVDAALEIIDTDGYEAVNMRSIAQRLDTGPSSLYAHVPHKLALDRRLVSRLWSALPVPDPDPATWRQDLVEVYLRQAELFGRHPGIEQAYLVSLPNDPAMLGFAERMLALFTAGGLPMDQVRPLEATLEAVALAHGLQTVALRRRRAASAEEQRAAAPEEWGGPDLGRFPLLADYLSAPPPDEQQRTANLARRLQTVIDAYAPPTG